MSPPPGFKALHNDVICSHRRSQSVPVLSLHRDPSTAHPATASQPLPVPLDVDVGGAPHPGSTVSHTRPPPATVSQPPNTVSLARPTVSLDPVSHHPLSASQPPSPVSFTPPTVSLPLSTVSLDPPNVFKPPNTVSQPLTVSLDSSTTTNFTQSPTVSLDPEIASLSPNDVATVPISHPIMTVSPDPDTVSNSQSHITVPLDLVKAALPPSLSILILLRSLNLSLSHLTLLLLLNP